MDHTVRTDREFQIRSVWKRSRSVNCILLVALKVFHAGCEWEIFYYGPYSSHGP